MSLGYFSDEVVEWLYENYSELAGSILYEFTTCQRPNGTVYGTAGTCRKGTEIEQRRQESINHLNTTLASLRNKRDKSPEESRSRINRLITKLETDLKAIQGVKEAEKKSTGAGSRATSQDLTRNPVDHSATMPEKTRNETSGFYGATRARVKDPERVEKRWRLASRAIQSQGVLPLHARRLLDSEWGRQLAKEAEGLLTQSLWQRLQGKLEKPDSALRRDFEKMLRIVTREDYED
jgi:hypothetical protein